MVARAHLRHTFSRSNAGPMASVAIALLAATAYALLSLNRYVQLGGWGFDLGIFTQAVRYMAETGVPMVPINFKSWPNFFGDHFEPVLYLLVPLWWLHPGAETLLVAQAVLVASSIPVVHAFAARRMGPWSSLGVAIAYASFWGIQSLVMFDFHEYAFAVPLVALMVERADKGRMWWAVGAALTLLLVKEDLGLTVAAFGLLLLVWRRWRWGLAMVLAGLGGTLLLLKVVVPFFNPTSGYVYFEKLYGQLGAGPGEVLRTALTNPLDVLKTLVTPSTKVQTLVATFLPWLFLPLFSPILLVALPSLLSRFLASRQGYWVMDFHYTGLLAPVLAMAFVDSVERVKGSRLLERAGARVRELLPKLAAGAVVVAAVVAVPQWSPVRAPLLGVESFMQPFSRQPGCYALVEEVPEGSVVEAAFKIAPLLVPRAEVWLPGQSPEPPQYLLEYSGGNGEVVPLEQLEQRASTEGRFEVLKGQGAKGGESSSALIGPSETGEPMYSWLVEAQREGYRAVASSGACRLWAAP